MDEKILTEFTRRIREYNPGFLYTVPTWYYRQKAYERLIRRHSKAAVLRHQSAVKAILDRAEALVMAERAGHEAAD